MTTATPINLSFDIIFHNDGTATFQTDHYCHHYTDMQQLAEDVEVYEREGGCGDWEGNEEEARFDLDDDEYEQDAAAGHYKHFRGAEVAGLKEYDGGWNNIRDFSEALFA